MTAVRDSATSALTDSERNRRLFQNKRTSYFVDKPEPMPSCIAMGFDNAPLIFGLHLGL